MNAPRRPFAQRLADCGPAWYLIAALILLAIIAGNYAVHDKAFAFVDIGSDTFFSFYPQQLEVSRLMRQFQFSGWSFHLGLGGFLGNLFDPTWLLTGWLPPDWQLATRLPVFFVRTLLAGGFMLAYLRTIGFEPRLAALGALCYAFSDYGMINAQWEILHGTEFVQLPAYLFLLESHLRGGSRWRAILAGVAVGLGNAFGLYEFAFFTLLYLAVRYLLAEPRPLKLALRETTLFGLWCIVGLALTAPLLLPATWHFLDNPRVSGAHSALSGLLHQILQLNDRRTISAEIGGFLGKNFFGIGNAYRGWANYLEGPSFYTSLLPLLCMTQLATKSATSRERRLFVLGTCGIVAYIAFPALRYAVFAFGHIAFRFSTLWISLIVLVLGLTGLRRALLSRFHWPALAASVLFIIGIVAAGRLLTPGTTVASYAFTAVALALAYTILLAISMHSQAIRHYLLPALMVLCVVEIASQSLPSVTRRINVKLDGSSVAGSYQSSQPLIKVLRDSQPPEVFFRMMKLHPAVYLDDPLAQGYKGTTSYYFHDASITRFIDRMHIPRPVATANYIGPPSCCPAIMDLLAVNYVLERDEQDAIPGIPVVAETGGWRAYRNTSALPFGFLVDRIVTEQQADSLGATTLHSLTRYAAIVASTQSLSARIEALDRAKLATDIPSDATIHLADTSRIEGTVSTDRARLLVLSIPFDKGWRAILDGESIDLIRVDYGLTGVLVPAGKHQLRMHYRAQGRTAGLVLAGIGLLVALFWPGSGQRRKRVNWSS